MLFSLKSFKISENVVCLLGSLFFSSVSYEKPSYSVLFLFELNIYFLHSARKSGGVNKFSFDELFWTMVSLGNGIGSIVGNLTVVSWCYWYWERIYLLFLNIYWIFLFEASYLDELLLRNFAYLSELDSEYILFAGIIILCFVVFYGNKN